MSNYEDDEVLNELKALNNAGSRAETVKIARIGISKTSKFSTHELGWEKKLAAQYRAAVALLWTPEKILQETGWDLQKFMSVEQYVQDENRRINSEVDPRQIFAEYKIQQLQAASELEDMATIFRNSKQFSSLVAAIKTRSDILDKIVKTGQDLGIVKRAAKEVTINTTIDYKSMSVSELRVHLSKEVKEINNLLEPEKLDKANNSVLSRLLPGVEKKKEVINTSAKTIKKLKKV